MGTVTREGNLRRLTDRVALSPDRLAEIREETTRDVVALVAHHVLGAVPCATHFTIRVTGKGVQLETVHAGRFTWRARPRWGLGTELTRLDLAAVDQALEIVHDAGRFDPARRGPAWTRAGRNRWRVELRDSVVYPRGLRKPGTWCADDNA